MIIARPTVQQERWLVLGDRYPALHAAIEAHGGGGGWKTTTWLGRVLGFVLGIVAVVMLAGVLSQAPAPWLVGGVLLVMAAEWLVAQRRVFRSGIEEALYACGAVGITVQLIIWNSHGGDDWIGIALVSLAVLLAGWRLLNPLFTTLAAAGGSLAIALVDGSLLGSQQHTRAAAVFCGLLALAALVASGREWQRPSHSRMLDGLVIAMPWLAHLWLVNRSWVHPVGTAAVALGVALLFLLMNLLAGVRRRQHAPLIGALGNLACVGWAAHRLVPWPDHWQLIAAGALLLAVAVGLERALRARIQGITSRVIDEPAALDLAQVAGAAHLAPAPGTPPPAGVQGQGGEFGGGGASSRF